MASYYTQFSFDLPCSDHEARVVAAALNGLDDSSRESEEFKEVKAFFDEFDEEVAGCGIEAEVEDRNVWIHTSEGGDLSILANVLQRFAPKALPVGFTYANTCSQPKLDAYSGGYIVISATDYDVVAAEKGLKDAMTRIVPGWTAAW